MLATSEHITAVIRFGAGVRGSIAPKVNCGIFESEPDGVMPVSAVLLAAISASTRISGIDAAPSSQGTPNQSCAIQTPQRPDDRHADPRDRQRQFDVLRARRRRRGRASRRIRLRKASTKTSGRANSATSEATTIIDDAPPERPVVEDVRAAEDRRAFGDRAGPRLDLAERDHDRHDEHEVERGAEQQARRRCGSPSVRPRRSSRSRASATARAGGCRRRRASAAARGPCRPASSTRRRDGVGRCQDDCRPSQLLLDQPHEVLAGDEAHAAGERAATASALALNMPAAAAALS